MFAGRLGGPLRSAEKRRLWTRTISGLYRLIAKWALRLGFTDVEDQILIRTSRLRKHAIKLREAVSHGAQHALSSQATPHGQSSPLSQ
jgi:hypothetical protein